MKRVISVIALIVLLAAISIPVSAAAPVAPVITAYKYSSSTNSYSIPASTLESNDFVMVRVALSAPVESLASLRLILEYPKDLISYVDGSFTSELVPGNPDAGKPLITNKSGRIVAFYSTNTTTGNCEIATNTSSVACFVFNCIGTSGDISLKATIDNALDKNYKDISFSTHTVTKKISISAWQLSAADAAVFESISKDKIAYTNACKSNIEKADALYNKLTANEKLMFKDKYPALFSNYQSAWKNYYDAGANASSGAIDKEVEKFKSDNSVALAIASPEGVNADNYQKVIDAIAAYKKLSGQAQIRALSYKEKLDSLSAAAEKAADSLLADDVAYNSFILEYTIPLWNAEVSSVNSENYGGYMVITKQAKAAYAELDFDNMSAAMKATVANKKAKLDEFLKAVADAAAKAGEAESIQKEISEFTKKWGKVLKLNGLTAGVADKTAVEMMLEDYNNLSDVANQRLASSKKSAEQILTMIKSLSNIQGSGPEVTVPQGGTTVVEKVVEKGVEKTKEVPVEKEVEKIVQQVSTKTQIRETPLIVRVIEILAGLSFLSVLVLAALYLGYKNKNNSKGANK